MATSCAKKKNHGIALSILMAPVLGMLQWGNALYATAEPVADPPTGDAQAHAADVRRQLEAAQQEIERLRQSLIEQERRLRADRAALEAQRRALQSLEHSMSDAHGLDAAGAAGARASAHEASGAASAAPDEALGLRVPVDAPEADEAQSALADMDTLYPVDTSEATVLRRAMNTAALAARSGRGTDDQQPAQSQASDQPAASTPTVGQAPESQPQPRQADIAPIFDQPGVLTPKGKYVLEPGLEYSYSSSNRVSVIGFEIFPALLIGVLDIRTANRASYIASLTGRYGITNRLEAEIKVPYVYRTETLQTREFLQASFADAKFSSTGSALGDVELALRYQFNQGEMDKRPYYIGTLRLKTRTGKDQFEVPLDADVPRNIGGRFREQPTGTGFYGIRPELTMIYPTDPLVFFGSVNYLWNIKRNNVTDRLNRTNDIDPGDAVGLNFGMGLALNERASFSIGYEHTIYGKTKVNGSTPSTELTTQLGSLLIGYSYRLSSNKTLNLALGIGATRDAPDVQVNLRMPINF